MTVSIITMIEFPAGGYCLSKECLYVVSACVGCVYGGAATFGVAKRKKGQSPTKECYLRRERDLPRKKDLGGRDCVSLPPKQRLRKQRIKEEKVKLELEREMMSRNRT
jgi:hypothetical protein